MSDESASVTRTKEEIAAMRPLKYLRGVGPVDDNGKPRDDLAGDFTTAACLAFEKGNLSPQEFAFVYEGMKQCFETAEGKTPDDRFRNGVDNAFDVVANMLRKEVNDALQDWIYEWFPLVENQAGIDAFMRHMAAALSQYTITISLKQPD